MGSDAPQLLLIGGGAERDVFHGEAETIRGIIQQHRTQDFVTWTGYVDDERLAALHSGSLGNLLVSECEGFGLPAVESAACGSPVIATTESPLPELLSGGGIFVTPGDRGAVEQGMRQLLDPVIRATLGDHARRRAGALTWERAAAIAHAALVEAAQ
jgi:glycosyltransferase involved in cell wall biosynthesis